MTALLAAILALLHPHPAQVTTTVPRPTPTTTAVTRPTPVASPQRALSAVWACIVAHESGGNPRAVNPSSGAAGLVQFMPSTWRAMGKSGTASDYPADVQMATAYRLQAMAGWSPWRGDGCVQ